MNITIRRADSKDYEIYDRMFACLNDLHAAEHPGIFQSISGHIHTPEFFGELLADPNSALFIAEWDGQPAGFLLMKLRTSPDYPIMTPRLYAVVDSVYVHPQFRMQGLGEMLMLTGEEWALENGADSLELNVYDFNTAARGLYEKLGYQTLSRKMLKWI
jgi:ribosomal protein S18 acetylase RimI-like enzyme